MSKIHRRRALKERDKLLEASRTTMKIIYKTNNFKNLVKKGLRSFVKKFSKLEQSNRPYSMTFHQDSKKYIQH